MKNRYWLFKRGAVFYLEDVATRKKESLKTTSKEEAERIRTARNEAAERPLLGLTLAKAYLSASDPLLPKRSWNDVIAELLKNGKPQTKLRAKRAFDAPVFRAIREKKILETTSEDFRKINGVQKPSFTHYLRTLHNLALGMGWLPWPIVPPKLWPILPPKKRRAVSASQQQAILDSETNGERRRYYRLLWETGAAQSDAANLSAKDLNRETMVLSFRRRKTGAWCHLSVGPRLKALLDELPSSGPFFPKISKESPSTRASEFSRRCALLSFEGISLHSYRYAFAERARAVGYESRWAQNALGHNSRAVHENYAKGAVAVCPPLEEYEAKAIRTDR